MDSMEPKKLALIRILQILQKHSDQDHPLTQSQIGDYLQKDYGILIDRRAISRNLSLLKEADIDIQSGHGGSYLGQREFEDSELRLLIDGVLCSKYIAPGYSQDLIRRLSAMASKHFVSHATHIHSVDSWNKTENKELFLNIELIDSAIEQKVQVNFTYNKIGIDKKLHASSRQTVTPYQLILNNQRYYLMGRNEQWGDMVFYRLDHITGMELSAAPATPVSSIPGYAKGIDYKKLSSTLPYMYSDAPQSITMLADVDVVDQIVDWFGRDIKIRKDSAIPEKVTVTVNASPTAMEHWAMQYINHVEITSPAALRTKIREGLEKGMKKYK
ncbi:MAG: WYL domain-containing protein [Lachnospiraceae bacterium]|nr:WYL domain-containing protein [Lachnospiraceae bacterium]